MTRIAPATRRRIESAVRKIEQLGNGNAAGMGAAPGGINQAIVVAQADIEHGAIGPCKLATGATPVGLTAGDTLRQVANVLGRKVWAGSLILASWASWKNSGSEASTVWFASNAWSATKVRGTAASAINTSQTGTLTALSFADGTGPTSVSAFNAGSAVAQGAVVWAELVFTSGVSRWEVITPAATGGGGTAVIGASRVYRKPRYWKTDGTEDTATPGYFCGTGDGTRRITFDEVIGPSIAGLSHSPSAGGSTGSFIVQEPSAYSLSLQIFGLQTMDYTASPMPPSPPTAYSLTGKVVPDPALTLDYTPWTNLHTFRTDEPLVGSSGVLFSGVNVYTFNLFDATGQRLIKYIPVAPSTKLFGIELARTVLGGANPTEFGFHVLSMELTITRLE